MNGPDDPLWRGRFLACGALVHVERQARAAYTLINDIDNPPKRKRAHPDTQTVEEHLKKIERLLGSIRRLLTTGDI